MQPERQYPLSANPIDEAAHAAARADGSLPERESEFGSSSAPLELVEGAATGGGEGEDCEPEGEGEDSDGQRMRRHRFEIGHIVWVKTRRADCCAVRTCDCMHSMSSLWFAQTAPLVSAWRSHMCSTGAASVGGLSRAFSSLTVPFSQQRHPCDTVQPSERPVVARHRHEP